MKILTATDYGFRRVVRVVINDSDPEWVDADGQASPPGDTGDTEEAKRGGMQLCLDCHSNWDIREFQFEGDALQVSLNKFGNPVHDSQDTASTRAKVWDEFYTEIDVVLGAHALFGDAPRKAPPVLVDETELDFELVATGASSMKDGLAQQSFAVFREGKQAKTVIVQGEDRTAFMADKDRKFDEAQQQILADESDRARAEAITAP